MIDKRVDVERGGREIEMGGPTTDVGKVFGLNRGAEGLEVTESDRLQLANDTGTADTLRCARALLVINTRLRTALPAVLFGSDVLGLLLHLFIAAKVQKTINVNEALVSSDLPPSTGIRWIKYLQCEGLVVVDGGQGNDQASSLALTVRAQELLDSWLEWSILEINDKQP